MGAAPHANNRTANRCLMAFAVGAVTALIWILSAGAIGSLANGPEAAQNPPAAIVNGTQNGYECHADRDPVTQSAQKNFFWRNSFSKSSANEYVSQPRTVIYDDSFVSMSVIYDADTCSFTVSHEYLVPTDELRNTPASKMPELVYLLKGRPLKLDLRTGSCDTVLPPQPAIGRYGLDLLLVPDCLFGT